MGPRERGDRGQERARAVGDLEECIRERYAALVRAVLPAAADRGDAEDAVAEAFARAWERIERGEHIDRVEAWVVTVALNLLRSRWRRIRVARRFAPALAALPLVEPDRAALLDLRAAVRALPRRQQQVVVLHHLLDLDVRTVAAQLGVSDGTVKSTLSRARAALVVALDAPDPEET